jgi:hypothetical protein
MNEKNKILLKLAEELSELTTRVLQQVNKKKNYSAKIDQEIKDIEKQLKLLKEINE